MGGPVCIVRGAISFRRGIVGQRLVVKVSGDQAQAQESTCNPSRRRPRTASGQLLLGLDGFLPSAVSNSGSSLSSFSCLPLVGFLRLAIRFAELGGASASFWKRGRVPSGSSRARPARVCRRDSRAPCSSRQRLVDRALDARAGAGPSSRALTALSYSASKLGRVFARRSSSGQRVAHETLAGGRLLDQTRQAPGVIRSVPGSGRGAGTSQKCGGHDQHAQERPSSPKTAAI